MTWTHASRQHKPEQKFGAVPVTRCAICTVGNEEPRDDNVKCWTSQHHVPCSFGAWPAARIFPRHSKNELSNYQVDRPVLHIPKQPSRTQKTYALLEHVAWSCMHRCWILLVCLITARQDLEKFDVKNCRRRSGRSWRQRTHTVLYYVEFS